jgi:hypothetical protein
LYILKKNSIICIGLVHSIGCDLGEIEIGWLHKVVESHQCLLYVSEFELGYWGGCPIIALLITNKKKV